MQQNTTVTEIQGTDETSLADIVYKYLPYWPLFVLLIIFTLAGAWVYLRYEMPVYETTASILIKDDQAGGGMPDGSPLQAFDLFGSQKNVENEAAILQSKTLMQQVVENLHLYAPVTVEGRVISQSAYVYSPIIIEARNPDSLKSVKRIDFTYNETDQSVHIANKKFPLNQWVHTDYGTLQFLPNPHYQIPENPNEKNHDYNFYFSLKNVKNAANSILSKLSATTSDRGATVIDLSIKGEVAVKGEDILNELLKVYNKAAILDKNVLAANTLKFVEDRLKFVVNDLDSVEDRLQHYKAKNNITDISSQGEIYLQTVAANDEKLNEINIQLDVLNQVEKYVSSKEGSGGIVPATIGVADPVLTGLLQKLSELELEYTQTKELVPENHPSVKSLADAIQKLKPGILENIHNQRSNLLVSKKNLTATINEMEAMLKTIPEKEKELLGINRQQSIKNNIYTFLLQKREETALSFASAVADSRIIDAAESSSKPVSPKKKLVYLGAFVLALGLGIAYVYLKDALTRTVQHRSEIEKYTDIPFLGEVSYDKSKSPIVITEGKRSFIAEQFRQLRTSLGYMGLDETHKRILITSSISGEGKSFIAINMGISLALMGKKVALLELDLRKPKLSEKFNISRHTGLSNYLIGKKEKADIIKDTGIENLYLIPAGPIPPNPSELISNGGLKALLASLEADFDYILMDTAPVNPVTDAYILSPLSDVTLFVIRHDYTPKVFLQNLSEQHKLNSLKNPAIVYNGIRGKGVNKYGYGNGYGYTDDDNEGKWWKNIFKR